MKNKRFNSFAKKILVGIMAMGIFVTVGCGNGDSGDNIGRNPNNPPVYESENTFRTAAWSLPPNANTGYGIYETNPNYATVENWKIMNDCGFEYALPTSDYSDEHIFNTLEKAEAVGMKVLVRDYSAFGIRRKLCGGKRKF